MKSLLLMFSVLALTKQSRAQHHYNKPQSTYPVKNLDVEAAADKNALHLGTQIIEGDNGKHYEVTLSASRKIYEKRETSTGPVFAVNQPTIGTTSYQTLPAYVYAPAVTVNPLTKTELKGNYQQPFNNKPQNINLNYNNQHNGNLAANGAQNRYNQFTVNSHYQQQVTREQEHQPHAQINTILHITPPQHTTGATQQQQRQFASTSSQATQHHQHYYPQQFQHYLPEPLRNNNLPNSNNLRNNLVNNQKYISQAEASQLDVYPYKQINGNPRPFTRIISKCEVAGQQCVPQNAAANGGSVGRDLQQQQVLNQSKAQIVLNSDKFENPFNIQFAQNAAKAQRSMVFCNQTHIKDRRLFPYTEVVIPQYPHN